MDLSTQHKQLYRIDESSDLMLDACVIDHNANLIFASVWGSDTATQSFLGKLTLGNHKDGMDHFHMLNGANASIPVFVGELDNFEKKLARFSRCSMFGNINNVWIYDKRCKFPDESKNLSYLLYEKDSLDNARLWSLIKATCSIPVLDEWQTTIITIMKETEMLVHLPTSLGPVMGYKLEIDQEKLTAIMGQHIRQGLLTIPASYNLPEPQTLLTVA